MMEVDYYGNKDREEAEALQKLVEEEDFRREQDDAWLKLFCPEHECEVTGFTDLP